LTVLEKRMTISGKKGAFAAAIEGIRTVATRESRSASVLPSIKQNLIDVGPCSIYLIRKTSRDCASIIVYTGRGSKLREEDLSHEEPAAA